MYCTILYCPVCSTIYNKCTDIVYYIITERIQALSLVKRHDLLEDRRTDLRHN
jgi:hypothetical protein